MTLGKCGHPVGQYGFSLIVIDLELLLDVGGRAEHIGDTGFPEVIQKIEVFIRYEVRALDQGSLNFSLAS